MGQGYPPIRSDRPRADLGPVSRQLRELGACYPEAYMMVLSGIEYIEANVRRWGREMESASWQSQPGPASIIFLGYADYFGIGYAFSYGFPRNVEHLAIYRIDVMLPNDRSPSLQLLGFGMENHDGQIRPIDDWPRCLAPANLAGPAPNKVRPADIVGFELPRSAGAAKASLASIFAHVGRLVGVGNEADKHWNACDRRRASGASLIVAGTAGTGDAIQARWLSHLEAIIVDQTMTCSINADGGDLRQLASQLASEMEEYRTTVFLTVLEGATMVASPSPPQCTVNGLV